MRGAGMGRRRLADRVSVAAWALSVALGAGCALLALAGSGAMDLLAMLLGMLSFLSACAGFCIVGSDGREPACGMASPGLGEPVDHVAPGKDL